MKNIRHLSGVFKFFLYFFVDINRQVYKLSHEMAELLSKKDVMVIYGIGRHLLDKAMRERQITYIKLERRVLFKREHIEEFLQRNIVKTIPEKEFKKLRKRAVVLYQAAGSPKQPKKSKKPRTAKK